ncbi:gliding motility-associated ABC transporter substrate-binding protein GldG [Robiginitalea sp. M366]|uniref:gliding motility-associated ABC transporter substrate-binding protein GldG n=1 Tax=Robiginitalea aestuariiviva TaxID=3036903 RepID=UPI00240D3906|nr:gliding motility-associated ABC transporter substrate-binding protein GldG [Robiginitalea aestuariiviva]MDG1572758.1 gliding motility-associated ABC transporter substrate-binding protein GldG [Robiginitalea aestuariiviva]
MKILHRLRPYLLAAGALVLVNLAAQWAYARWDLTEDGRFTLATPSVKALQRLDGPIVVDLLLDGDLPPEFARLQRETVLLLEQFSESHPQLHFEFLDPVTEAETTPGILDQLQAMGMKAASVTTEEGGRVSQEVVFPWAVVNHGDRSEVVPLLRNLLGADTEARVNRSIQNLEYAFADAFTKLGITDPKKIAVLKGNGEVEDRYLADYLGQLGAYYRIAPFTLDSVDQNPKGTLEALETFDAALIAKPTEGFTDAEKLVLDQFMVRGGRTLWLIDPVAMEMDSLRNRDGQSAALPRDLNLDDLLFRYGVRLNRDLVADLFCTQIVLATGSGTEAQYDPLPWVYNPMVISREDHPLNTNTEALRMQFASSLDTLENAYRKTILYRSSPRSRPEGAPRLISLDIIRQEPNPEAFQPGNLPLAVLVEGAFQSAYRNRVLPADAGAFTEQGPENKMIVVADGDLASNAIREGRPLELGYDPWTNNFYGNRDFLVNAMNYLLEDTGLINIRNKQVAIPMLDPARTAAGRSGWQWLNLGVPLLLVFLGGAGAHFWRKRHYGG